MEKCLVTKLKGAVDNQELLRIGEIGLDVDISTPAALELITNVKCTLRIIGDGYFTNESNGNLGTSFQVPASTESVIYVSAGKYKIAISDKYDFNSVRFSKKGTRDYNLNPSVDIDSFKYSKNITVLNIGNKVYGDMSALKDLKNITFLSINSPSVVGDISTLQDMKKLNSLYLIGCSGIVGDIAALKGKNISFIDLSKTTINGDIANLSSCTSLHHINASGVFTGNISVFKNASNLNYVTLGNSSLTGDLAKLPDTCTYFSSLGSFTWSERTSSAKIITLDKYATIDNVDKMLQDQAKCEVPVSSPFLKIIFVTGSRTSASDAAVQTLQSKGYTVSVTPA